MILKIRKQGIKSKYTQEYIIENGTMEQAIINILEDKRKSPNMYKYIGIKIINKR